MEHLCDFQRKVLTAGRAEEEDKRIAAAIDTAEGIVVLLDERGKQLDSTEFAGWLGSKRDIGHTITFVIGGAYGFSDALRARGLQSIALGRMTLPHELAQLVFLEQLYRAHGILAGSGYHHQ